jgi:hypothetical protein
MNVRHHMAALDLLDGILSLFEPDGKDLAVELDGRDLLSRPGESSDLGKLHGLVDERAF